MNQLEGAIREERLDFESYDEQEGGDWRTSTLFAHFAHRAGDLVVAIEALEIALCIRTQETSTSDPLLDDSLTLIEEGPAPGEYNDAQIGRMERLLGLLRARAAELLAAAGPPGSP